MSEYIIEIPDEYFASYDTERDMYYPDERDSAMPITPFVRCRDCRYYYEAEEYNPHFNYIKRCCEYFGVYDNEVNPNGFCKWGERRA